MDDNPVASRGALIAAAASGAELGLDRCIIVVTGDIAFSGLDKEYALAASFLDTLSAAILQRYPSLPISEVLIPGNHDCDFSGPQAVRQVVIEKLRNATDADATVTGELLDLALTVQSKFFTFLASREHTAPRSGHGQQLNYQVLVADNSLTLAFNCINTAWMSTIVEQQGQLMFPLGELKTPPPSALVISIFHHPYNWLAATNARAFRNDIERWSDIILTGHEHVSDSYTKTRPQGFGNDYLEGAVLQDKSHSELGFNTVLIDSDVGYKATQFTFSGDMYRPASQPLEWTPFRRDLRAATIGFRNTKDFRSSLADAGAAFSHPRRPQVRLPDIFVYPDLKRLAYGKPSLMEASPSVPSDGVVDFFLKKSAHVVLGPDKSGKTALAKTLYGDYLRHHFVPILLEGASLTSPKAEAIDQVIFRCAENQYGLGAGERYRQLARDRRVILVDDFDHSRLARSGQQAAAAVLLGLAGHVVLLASDLFPFEEFQSPDTAGASFLTFEHTSIAEMGHRLRGTLIEAWVRLGADDTVDERDTAFSTADVERTVDTLLGKGLVPAYPLYILIILQSYELRTSLQTASGALGHYYEILILHSLQNRTVSITLDTLYTFVGLLAYDVFIRKRPWIRLEEFDGAIDRYHSIYGIRLSRDVVLRALLEARVLRLELDGTLRFRYSYIYCFFVARYFAEALRDPAEAPTVRGHVAELAGHLYVEDVANIVIFLVYFSKDEATIRQLLDRARGFLDHRPTARLEGDVEFVNKMSARAPSLRLPAGSTREHKVSVRTKMDTVEQGQNNVNNNDSPAQPQDFDDVVQLNMAAKTVQILGQILRNFPGALKADLKQEIAAESYKLGLRVLGTMFEYLKEHLHILQKLVSARGKETRPLQSPSELADWTDRTIFSMAVMLGDGMLRRVSDAVGSPYLEETYSNVALTERSTAVSLIDVAIKLDHRRGFPESDVLELFNTLRDNRCAATILRLMVRDHFYLYPINYRVRQKVCGLLAITASDPKMIVADEKRS
jgi:hypothetical protein